ATAPASSTTGPSIGRTVTPRIPFPAVPRRDRPQPPHDWRWVVGGIGRVLIAVGLLMFGFVAYQLWGTGIEYRQSHDRLAGQFASLIQGAPSSATTTTVATTSPPSPTPPPTTAPTTAAPTTAAPSTAPPTTAAVPDFGSGDVMALIEIPSIGVHSYVVSGVEPA